jgi:hypothetical protein
MLPSDMLIGEVIDATEDKLYAINGQQLRVLGKVDVMLEAHELTLLVGAFVVDGIGKPTLGLEWLRCNKVVWNFGADTVVVGGVEIPLATGIVDPTPDVTQTSEGWRTQSIVDAAPCAINSSSSGGRTQRSEVKD